MTIIVFLPSSGKRIHDVSYERQDLGSGSGRRVLSFVQPTKIEHREAAFYSSVAII